MCGIAGVFSSRDSTETVQRMTNALNHRGPDDRGSEYLSDTHGRRCGAFGHRRLAILDLTSAGHQPMSTADGRYCITYNGEIYNFPELKRDLETAGARFRSHCDTEAILIGWELYGRDFVRRLRGMFAFALWDSDARRGYLARDAFGIKPLYIASAGQSLLFASEVRALLESGEVNRALSPAGLASFLNTGSVAEPYTIVQDVSTIPAGTIVEVSIEDGNAVRHSPHRFAHALESDEGEVTSFSQSAFQLRNALRDSVSHHLLSDVDVAMFLSGGVDSSALVGIASEVSPNPLETFTVTFSEEEFSEADLGRRVANRFSTRHHEVPLLASDLLDALPVAFAAMDQPSLDGLNTYIVSRAVRSFGIKVALSGLGGDELFAGYPSFRRAARLSPLWRLPFPIRRLSAFAARGLHGVRGEKIELLMRSSAPADGAYRASRMLFGERHTARLLDGKAKRDRAHPLPPHLRLNTGLSLLRDVSVRELTGYMRNTLLRDSDVFSMAHGLELRVPFVDRMVVRVAARAADSSKLRGPNPKPLLVKAVEDLLPPELLTSPKRGFTLPFEKWMRTDLHNEIDAMFSSPDAERAGLSRTEAREVWRSFEQSDQSVTWSRPWALYTLIRWARENGFGPAPDFAEGSTAADLDFAGV